MRTFIGIDLGSTTTKAVLLDENQDVIGRGITNSRSNYGTAARVASEEARIDGRFTLFRRALRSRRGRRRARPGIPRRAGAELPSGSVPGAARRSGRHLHRAIADRTVREVAERMGEALNEVFGRLKAEAPELYAPGAKRKSDFFRDIAGSRFHVMRRRSAKEANVPHEILLNAYDKSIIEVENRPPAAT